MNLSNSLSIAIVCSRNLARSIFLEKYLSSIYPNFIFSSFGTKANEGEMMPPHIQSISDYWGLEIRNHQASNLRLNLDRFVSADIVITAVNRLEFAQYLPVNSKMLIFELSSKDTNKNIWPSDPFGKSFGSLMASPKWSELQLAKTLLSGKLVLERIFSDLRSSGNQVHGYISSNFRFQSQMRRKLREFSLQNENLILVCSSFSYSKYWINFFPNLKVSYVNFQSDSFESVIYRKLSGKFGVVILIHDREPLDEARFLLGLEFRTAIQSLEKFGEVILLPSPNYVRAKRNPETYLRLLNASLIAK